MNVVLILNVITKNCPKLLSLCDSPVAWYSLFQLKKTKRFSNTVSEVLKQDVSPLYDDPDPVI